MYSRETCETSVDFDQLEEIAEREYEELHERLAEEVDLPDWLG